MATRILLVRHGETTWNQQSRLQGQVDTPLSVRGEQQAARLGERLAKEEIDAVYASDLERAWRTAEIAVASRGLAVQRSPVWRELGFGDWEGLTYDDVVRRDPELARRRLADPAHVAPPGGENLNDLAQRLMPAAARLRDAHEGQTVLLVTHGGPLRVLACVLLGLDLNRAWRFEATNCGLSSVRWYEWAPVIELWNDTLHLADL
jgi:alpha-ribazole phosphatase